MGSNKKLQFNEFASCKTSYKAIFRLRELALEYYRVLINKIGT